MTETLSETLKSLATEELLLATVKAINKDNPPYALSELIPAIRLRLPTMPTEDLLKAYFAMWRCDVALFNPTEIFTFLRSSSGQSFDDDIDKWMAWFLEQPDPKLDIARFWIKIQHDIYKTESRPQKQ